MLAEQSSSILFLSRDEKLIFPPVRLLFLLASE